MRWKALSVICKKNKTLSNIFLSEKSYSLISPHTNRLFFMRHPLQDPLQDQLQVLRANCKCSNPCGKCSEPTASAQIHAPSAQGQLQVLKSMRQVLRANRKVDKIHLTVSVVSRTPGTHSRHFELNILLEVLKFETVDSH